MKTLRLALIGLDTSHVEGLAAHYNDPQDPGHIPGGRIVVAYPGGSPDFPLSADRVGGYTALLRDKYGAAIVSSPRAAAEGADAVLLTSVDGRVHWKQFAEIAPLGRPVFIDKPFATTSADAQAIAALACSSGTPLFSASSLRFSGGLRAALADGAGGRIVGAEFFGPMSLQPTQPGFFWYGIHTAEMLYAALGPGCGRVRVISTVDHDIAVGTWQDGRIGSIRGNRVGNKAFGGIVHRENSSQWIDVADGLPPDRGVAAAIMDFFHGGPAPVPLEETLEIVRFLEAANESRDSGGREVFL